MHCGQGYEIVALKIKKLKTCEKYIQCTNTYKKKKKICSKIKEDKN